MVRRLMVEGRGGARRKNRKHMQEEEEEEEEEEEQEEEKGRKKQDAEARTPWYELRLHGMVVKAQVSQDCQWRELNAAEYEVLVGARDAFHALDALDDCGDIVWGHGRW